MGWVWRLYRNPHVSSDMSMTVLETRENRDGERELEASHTRSHTRPHTRVGAISPAAEAFCLLVAQGRALNAAWRQVFDVAPDTKAATVNNNAHSLAKRCAPRIAELQAAIAERVVTTAAALRMRQHAIAHAPALTHSKVYNCRYCPSGGKHHAWADISEYAEAVEEAYASKKAPPPSAGGFTFDAFAPPNPRCRRCRGVGERFVYGPQDTTQLDPELAASYRGASVDPRTGVVKIEQADPDAALRELTAMTPGGYAPKQSESKAAVEHTHRVVPAEMSVEEARAALARHRRAPVIIEQLPPVAQDNIPLITLARAIS